MGDGRFADGEARMRLGVEEDDRDAVADQEVLVSGKSADALDDLFQFDKSLFKAELLSFTHLFSPFTYG